CMQNVQLPITF
nr:immunoglobulin light chain junction region [Macaca mulatta]MOX98191.1 immunoglobulin light chain junction region [Macaca mulatta]MOX98360.1 immunoglobulin light chain junction region [Macaca mulatta]MOX98517.1 immunoglobulin light chain junction region [Macaca mulatta]MOX98699.1 immunoglobulin light chain junction region [Macaca mulatta]